MMKTNPITPPPELVEQWEEQWCDMPVIRPSINSYIATQAAQWGADQELEACCEWLECNYNYPQVNHPLRAARRPEPPTLKEQALEQCNDYIDPDGIIRRALEQLPN